jgi:LTXXQ motif family protein
MFWTRRTRIAVAAVALAAVLPSLAAGASWHDWGRGRQGGSAGWCQRGGSDRLAEGIALIEMQLALKPAQQDAWARVAEAVERVRRDLAGLCGGPVADVPSGLARLETGIEAGLKAVRELRPHLEALYAVLEPGQRARLDGLLKDRL